jgi:hypothetical protein
MPEVKYIDEFGTTQWEQDLREKEIELQKKQTELRERLLKLQNWEKEFSNKTSIVTANGIVIKKIFNA